MNAGILCLKALGVVLLIAGWWGIIASDFWPPGMLFNLIFLIWPATLMLFPTSSTPTKRNPDGA